MKAVRQPLPRPIAVWAATLVVALQCWSVPIGMVLRMTQVAIGPAELFFVLISTLVAVMVFGCQAVAVFRRSWTVSWMAAAGVGVAFATPGGLCLSTLPLAYTSQAGNPPSATYYVLVAVMGFWSAVNLGVGVVMLWWARRLYRWRVQPWPLSAY